MADEHRNLSVTREMQIKAQYNVNIYLLKGIKQKTVTTSSIDKNVEKLDQPYFVDENVKWYIHHFFKKTITVFYKINHAVSM